MPATAPSDDLRPGFLLGQPFWLAEAKTPAAGWAMAVHEAEPSDDRTKFESGIRPPEADRDLRSDGGRWQRIDDRAELVRMALEDPFWSRVGLVCGAGLGKTTTLRWLEAAINRLDGGRGKYLAFYRGLEGIPEQGDDLLLEFARRVADAVGIGESAALEHVRQFRYDGKIILLLDSLDQGDPNPAGPAVRALKNLFTGSWSDCRIWVSGRPYAFRLAGSSLREGRPNAAWQFVRVGQLDEPECRQLVETTSLPNLPRENYPEPHRFGELAPAGRRLARVPRYGRLMALLPPERFAQLTNEATTLWELYNYVAAERGAATGMLDDGLRAEPACRLGWHHEGKKPPKTVNFRIYQVRLAHDILGAVAFEMFAQGSDGEQAHPLFHIEADLNTFLDAARDRLVNAGAYFYSVKAAIPADFFTTDWESLIAMDSHGLKNFIFSADGRDGRLQWTDISTATYFAAYWACKWGGADEWAYTRRWIVDPVTDENAAFREFWQFAIDLPPDAIDRDRWIELFSPLYTRPTNPNTHPVRSTEFLYRSWERMRGSVAQQEFLNDLNHSTLTGDPKWREGFIALAQPKSSLPGDTGTFVMGASAEEDPEWDRGDNPQHPVQLTAYRLHQFCVTNRDYEIFDPRHKSHRWSDGNHSAVAKKKPNADDDYPAVNVSWYDAWCFAQWLGAVEIGGRSCRVSLPSEAQWEYACRAGRKTPFTFCKGHPGLSITPDVCNFDGNHMWPDGTKLPKMAKSEVYRESTIAVQALGPNVWGLYQMHGNVWEWCTDWYLTTFYLSEEGCFNNPVNNQPASARVLRGGSWYYHAGNCRSAYRRRNGPEDRRQNFGFRLAAVPVVGAKSSKS